MWTHGLMQTNVVWHPILFLRYFAIKYRILSQYIAVDRICNIAINLDISRYIVALSRPLTVFYTPMSAA